MFHGRREGRVGEPCGRFGLPLHDLRGMDRVQVDAFREVDGDHVALQVGVVVPVAGVPGTAHVGCGFDPGPAGFDGLVGPAGERVAVVHGGDFGDVVDPVTADRLHILRTMRVMTLR